jgi:hypothetical protein
MIDKIVFGNNVGYKINDYLIKKKILDYLLDNVEPYNFIYTKISEENHLMKIKNTQYFVCPNIIGENYIFISKKINSIFYSVIINKKNIMDIKNINYNDVIIISLKIRLCEKTYDGTILDGKIINVGGCSVFLINDGYQIYGKDIIDENIHNKFKKINDFLDNSYIIDNNMNVIDFRLNKLNEINDIKDLIYNRMKKSIYIFDSIIFIPKNKNTKYIYYLNNKHNLNLEKIMKGKRIDIDVVELYAKDDEGDRRIGIAHIPTKKCSKICFDNLNYNELLPIKCRLNICFKKWEPIEIYLDHNVKISSYSEIRSIMMNIVSKEKQL